LIFTNYDFSGKKGLHGFDYGVEITAPVQRHRARPREKLSIRDERQQPALDARRF